MLDTFNFSTKNVYLGLVSGLTGQPTDPVDQTCTAYGLSGVGPKYCITMDYLKKLVHYPHGPQVSPWTRAHLPTPMPMGSLSEEGLVDFSTFFNNLLEQVEDDITHCRNNGMMKESNGVFVSYEENAWELPPTFIQGKR